MTISTLEALNLSQCVTPGILARTTGGQQQPRMVVYANKLSRHQEDAVAQGLERGVLQRGRQTEPLEPVDEIIGEQQQVKVRLVGEEVACRDSAQRIVAFEAPDNQLDTGAIVAEAPEVERLQSEVGDEHLIMVSPELEERELRRGFLGLGPANDDKTKGMRPSMRLIVEPGGFDAATDTAIAQTPEFSFEGRRQARHDHEVSAVGIDPTDQRPRRKTPCSPAQSRVASNRCVWQNKPAAELVHRARYAHRPRAAPRASNPWWPLEAEQWMLRRPSALHWVVTDACILLLTVDDEHRRVDIEKQPCRSNDIARCTPW